MSTRRDTRSTSQRDDSEDDDDTMSALASPASFYTKSGGSRGRSKDSSREEDRSASRSRSRSSSVFRKLFRGDHGKKDKKFEDTVSVASGKTSLGSIDTKNSKIKKIKTIRKTEGSSRPSSSGDRIRSSSCDRPRHHSFSDPVEIEESSPLGKKLRKKNKMKYKSHRVKDSGGVDSDGDYGAADSDGDVGSLDGQSLGSEGILSIRRKVRRKKKPKKSIHEDDETLGSSKVSLTDICEFTKTSRVSSRDRGVHNTKVATLTEPPLSPEGQMLKDEMDDLFPSPKSEKKKLPRVKRKGKPDISVISFEKDDFSPIVDRTPGARPSDYRKQRSNETEATSAAFRRMVEEDFACTTESKSARPRLPADSFDADTAGSWRMENVGTWRKNGKMEGTAQNHDSGLSVDAMPHEVTSSSRSMKSARSYGKYSGDNDTVLSMTDTVSSLNKHLEEQNEETKSLQKQLNEALSKVASLNEELRREEGSALKAMARLTEVTAQLEKIENENVDLRSVMKDMKDDLIAKDDRIEKLQQIVETQLDTVELLEVKLEQTEDELFMMEDELRELDDGGLLNKSVRAQSLLKRKNSVQRETLTRKGSIRAQAQESRSILGDIHNTSKRSRSGDDLEEREVKIAAREKKLEEWEKNLVSVDVQLKQVGQHDGEEARMRAKLHLMEKRERRMEENLEALLQEKEKLQEKIQSLEDTLKNSMSSMITAGSTVENEALKLKIKELERKSDALEKEVDSLQKARRNDSSKINALENDKQDLLVRLDHVRDTTIKDEENHRLQIAKYEEELSILRGNGDAGSGGPVETIQILRKELAEKEARITDLEENSKRHGENRTEDREGKDLLIRELQNQLVAAKKEVHDLTSGDQVKRLRIEAKALKQSYNDLKKQMKKAELHSRSEIMKKEETLCSLKKEMGKMQRELERLEKREKNLRSDGKLEVGDLQKHIEDLEDEIDHWKTTNADLENELDLLKAESNDFHKDPKCDQGDLDDDNASTGSLQSTNSYMSEQQGTDMSVTNGLFFVSDSNSVRSHRSISVSLQAPAGVEPSTPSQRALLSVSNLWSKIRNEPVPLANPAIPYSAGILDDD